METGEIAQMIGCSLCKPEVQASAFRVHIEEPGLEVHAVNPVLRRQMQEDPWESLPSSPAYMASSLPVSDMVPNERDPMLSYSLLTRMHANVPENKDTHTLVS